MTWLQQRQLVLENKQQTIHVLNFKDMHVVTSRFPSWLCNIINCCELVLVNNNNLDWTVVFLNVGLWEKSLEMFSCSTLRGNRAFTVFKF